MFKKILMLSCLVPLASSVVSCYNDENSSIVGHNNEHYFQNKTNIDNYYIKNAFVNNAIELANENNIIVYSIGWQAVLHKYGMLSHMLKILELNPNKEIFLYISYFNENDFDISIFNEYPNVKIVFLDKNMEDSWKNFDFYSLNEFLNDINYEFDLNKKYHLFCDDYQILKMTNYKLDTIQKKKNFVKSFYFLLKNFSSLNMIADGTASAYFWDNSFYNKFQNKLLEFNETFQIYMNAIQNLKSLKQMDIENFYNWINDDNYYIFILMLCVSNYGEKIRNEKPSFYDGNLIQTNFFVPTTDMIIDLNNKSSSLLSNNDDFNEYFDPYYSLNIDYINFFKSFDDMTKNKFLKLFKIESDFNKIENDLRNSTNIIFSGKKLNDKNIIIDQANKLISLFNDNKNIENLKIWFKGHPKDTNDIYNVLYNKIYEITGEKPTWFHVLDHVVPMEYYVSSGLLTNNISENKKIYIYSSFSTYVLFIEGSRMYDIISKILVNESDFQLIQKIFGNSFESICFPIDKIEKN